MEYTLTFKPGVAENLKQQMMRSGQGVSDRILHAPQLTLCLEFFFDSFWKLSSCRSVGMGEGPIPLTAIMEYGRFCECDDEMMLDLIDYVIAMDQVYLKHQHKESKRKTKK